MSLIALLMALLVGTLMGAGVYLVLRRNLFDVLLGLALFSTGTNVLLLAMSGWNPEGRPPILTEPGRPTPDGIVSQVDPATYVDPLPQALILTALVIGFGLIAFLIVLVVRTHATSGTLEAGEVPDPDAAPPAKAPAEAARP